MYLEFLGHCFSETINSHRHVTHSDISEHLSDFYRTYAYFQQNSARVHTASNITLSLHSVSGDKIISRGLWPPCSPDLNMAILLVGNFEEQRA
jgi:hypothetical protein